ncbi:glycosyltransferase [Paenibacillus crassostreae]|uniref:Uncharacterized protein n=1 Tax=Paenibacillus crassostreae TaxID=1763538 RepID=A0A167D8S3_9BACL|nr:glycosyltransferase [Paenibacillus crassostreae]AOZ93255.1 hypothetical protein LPB68_14240 [Paenibacillus crassostreae]OAB74078.1 hypothetical protein PNBC_13080 [Paenibacillus crassostreae]
MNRSPQRVAFINGVPVGKGGIEKAIMDVYNGIDQQQLQIDFIVRKPQKGYYHDEIESSGGEIINIFENKKHKGNKKWNVLMDIYSVFSFYKNLKSRNCYRVVHIAHPLLDGFLIIAAKLAGVPVRIVHSNNTGIDDYTKTGITTKITRKLRRYVCNRFATHIWGCSEAACEYLFDKKILQDPRTEIVPYPVVIKDFKDIKIDKIEAREKLGVPTSTINYVNVGRYATQKNQIFLLDFFVEMLRIRSDLHLMLTGPGPLEDQIRQRIKDLNLESHVTMLDSDSYIPVVLKASDYFLLPSIYEGFGIVLIEAQALGIPCFVSDACQPEPNEGLVDYIPLNKGALYWAEYIVSQIGLIDKREVDLSNLLKYDVSNVAPRMQRVYLEGIKYSDASTN